MTTAPIVGAYYHPPAKTILEILAVGTPLIMRAEPHNPYDENAIAVFVRGDEIQQVPGADSAFAGYGMTFDEVQRTEEFHLGYVPRNQAAELRAYGFPDNRDVGATFSVSASGAARVRFNETWRN